MACFLFGLVGSAVVCSLIFGPPPLIWSADNWRCTQSGVVEGASPGAERCTQYTLATEGADEP